MVIRPYPRLFTVEEYHRMGEAGTIKAALYAVTGVQEVWIVDLEHRQVEVFRSPGPNGYAEVSMVGSGGRLSLLALPDVVVSLEDALGPQTF